MLIKFKKSEKFSASDAGGEQEHQLRTIGIIFLIWASLLYLLDTTIFGKIFYGLFSGYFSEDENGTLDLSVKVIRRVPEMVLPSQGVTDDDLIEARNKIMKGGDETEFSYAASIPKFLTIILIFIGMVLVLHSYSNTKSLTNIAICPICYAFAYVCLIGGFKNTGNKRLHLFIAFVVFLLIGILLQALNVEEGEVEEEEILEPPVVTTTA